MKKLMLAVIISVFLCACGATEAYDVDKDLAFRASDMDVDANSQPYEVVFAVDSAESFDRFDLFIKGDGKVGELYDNGDTNNGDDIAGDGCYTGTFVIDGYEGDIDLYFYVQSVGGQRKICSESINVFVYTPFTEEELDLMATLDNKVVELINSVDIPEGTSDEEMADLRYQAVKPYLDEVSDENNENRLIDFYEYDGRAIYCEYKDLGFGNTFMLVPEEWEVDKMLY